MSIEENRRLIGRYYEELWNEWNFDLAAEIVSHDVRFRGSLGVEVQGLRAFIDYMLNVKRAFPDFSNKIEELIATEESVSARLTYTATHGGEIFGVSATDKRVTYSGVAMFKIKEGKIADGWVLGDVQNLLRQLNADPLAREGISPASALPGSLECAIPEKRIRHRGRYKGKTVEVLEKV